MEIIASVCVPGQGLLSRSPNEPFVDVGEGLGAFQYSTTHRLGQGRVVTAAQEGNGVARHNGLSALADDGVEQSGDGLYPDQ
jgi:hypothetical protein